ncbi:suppressor of fused domain protein [Bryobacter aggregatus]|uniref:suppressor of fused domain protein n=1 Tax=Bryobacter aggregatus TaxID=360054 RepID=UPI0004E1B839|nr:suppressor of fused domain protein [Bryobacter aggregatus]
MSSGRPEVISEDKQVTRKVTEAFGETYTLERQSDPTRKFELSVLCFHGQPAPGISSYSTIGLWRTPLEPDPHTRLELVGAFPSDKEGFSAVLATAAFRIMRTQKPIGPGDVFPGYMREWYPKCTVPHLFFTLPSTWAQESLLPFRMGNLEVSFLQALPISDGEYDYLSEHGEDSLEIKLIQNNIDFYDLKRKSAV